MRRIEADEWFVLDGHRDDELALRSRLYRERRCDVFACEPDAEPAAVELAGLVRAWLARRGSPPPTPADHPLAEAGLAVQDDLCVMQRDDRGWRFVGAIVCFPTYWRLADKIGGSHSEVHAPVPHYRQELDRPVDRFFDRLAPDRLFTRRNWGITPHHLLFLPDRSLVEAPARPRIEDLWLRSERQSLRRLPSTEAIVFGIRVQQAPLVALGEHVAVAHRLAAVMRSWSPAQRESRGERFGLVDPVVEWLEGLEGPGGARPAPA
jgi:hypothetical protein